MTALSCRDDVQVYGNGLFGSLHLIKETFGGGNHLRVELTERAVEKMTLVPGLWGTGTPKGGLRRGAKLLVS